MQAQQGVGFPYLLDEFALAPHLVRVPTIVPDELEAFVRDVLGDGGDEVAGIEHLEPTAGRTADAKRRQ